MLSLIDLLYEPVELYSSVDFLERIVREGKTKRLPRRSSKDYSMFYDAVGQSIACNNGLCQIMMDLDQANLQSLDFVMREINFKRGLDRVVMSPLASGIIEETWAAMQEFDQYDIQPDCDYKPVFDVVLRVLRSYQNAAQFYLDMKAEPATSEDEVTAKIRMTPPHPLPLVAKR